MAATAPGKPAAPTSNNRYIVLIAGIVGVLGMFQPLMELGRGKLHFQVTAYELSFGLSRTHKVIDAKIPFLIELKIPAEIRSARDDIKTVLDASKHAALAYIPAALLVLIGAYAVLRKRLGRALGGAALLFGLASIVAYIGLRYGLAYGKEEEPILKRVHLDLALGAHVLLAVGIGGAIAGLASLLKPDR